MKKEYYVTLQDGVIRDFSPSSNYFVFTVDMDDQEKDELKQLLNDKIVAEFDNDSNTQSILIKEIYQFIKSHTTDRKSLTFIKKYMNGLKI